MLKQLKELLLVFVATARKWLDGSARIVLNTRQSMADLDLEKNAACVARMDTLMMNVEKFPDKAPKWYKDQLKKVEAAGSSVEVVLANVDEPISNEQDFHGACL